MNYTVMRSILLLLNFLSLAFALNGSIAPTSAPTVTPWGGCVDPSGSNSDPKIYIGKPAYVCIQLSNTTDWTTGVAYRRMSFSPKADQYSRFTVPQCTFLPFCFVDAADRCF
jgi:hypothetical protein